MLNKYLYLLLSFGIVLFFGLSACAGQETQPPATEVPHLELPATEIPATEAPATEVPIEPTPTLEPISLAGPPMEVGSKYLYVDGSVLVAIPAGEFIMGHGGDDNPEHTVYLDDFWIYRSPVTNQQYAFCVNSGSCLLPDLDENVAYGDPYRVNEPVVGVNHDQAVSYCEFVNGRLPTEAEWEKTARGPDGNIYPWGNAAPSCDLLNAAQCVNKTTPVTAYPQGSSFYEALDMAGNVFEWVADWYSPTYYTISPVESPLGPETGDRRSVRSSGFNAAFFETESARRFSANPIDHRNDLGFRCVVEDPLEFAPFCEMAVVYGMAANGLDPLSSPDIQVSCPDLSISQGQYCGDNNTPLTNVQFNANPSSTLMTINAGSCIDLGGDQYLCDSTDAISVCAECIMTVNEDPQCPPGYHLDGLKCVPDQPAPGRCLPGTEYDPANQCCIAQPGSLPGGSPVCPTGTYYYNPPGGCFAIPGAGTVCESDTVALKNCKGSDDPGDGPCPPGQTYYCPPTGGGQCYCR